MKSKENNKRKFKMITIIAVSVIAIIGITMAWFTVTQGPLTQLFNLSNFDAKVMYYFEGNEAGTIPTEPSNGTILVSTKPSADNYIGKLRLNVAYKGASEGYIRVKMMHSFKMSGFSTQYSAQVPYVIANPYLSEDSGDLAKWYDNSNADFCYYYAKPVQGNNTDYTEIPLITGIDEEEFDSDSLVDDSGSPVLIQLVVEVQMVQTNRYVQFWDIQKLPWTDAAI